MSDVKWLVKEKKSRMHSRVINSFPGNVVYGMRTFFIIHKLGFSFGHFEKNLDVKKAPKPQKWPKKIGLFLTTERFHAGSGH